MNPWLQPFWAVCLWLTVLGSRAEESPSALPPRREVRLGTFPPPENIVVTQGNSRVYLSQDGLHVVVVARAGQQFVAYSDGQPGRAYDEIGGVALSPAGGHIAYAAKKGTNWVLVFDGKEGAPCDGIKEAWNFKPQYNNGRHTTYAFGTPSPNYALQFSDDGKHFVYASQTGTRHSVVMDGQAGPEYDGVGELQLSANGRHFAYLAKQDRKQMAIIDGKAGPEYAGVGPLDLSHDGRHAVYVAWQADKYFVIVDGVAGPPFDFIDFMNFGFGGDDTHFSYSTWMDPQDVMGSDMPRHFLVVDGRIVPGGTRGAVFSADRRHRAYVAELDTNTVEAAVINGRFGPRYASVGSLQLSANGQHVAYIAYNHHKYFEVFDGWPGPEYDRIAESVLSPDGRRIAYEARVGMPGQDFHGNPIPNDTEIAQSFIVVDGTPGPTYDGVEQLRFSADGRHVAYMAVKDDHWLAVLDGKEGMPYRHIWGMKFSADGKHLAYMAAKDDGKNIPERMVAVVDGHESREYEMILEGYGTAPVFTSSGRLTYLAVRGGELYRVSQPLAK